MKPSEFMTESRQAQELKSASGKLTVMYLSTTKDFARAKLAHRAEVGMQARVPARLTVIEK